MNQIHHRLIQELRQEQVEAGMNQIHHRAPCRLPPYRFPTPLLHPPTGRPREEPQRFAAPPYFAF